MAKIDLVKKIEELNAWDLGTPIHRSNEVPLDTTSVFMSFEDAQRYASGEKVGTKQDGATAYVGQQIYVINETEGTVDTYVIQDEAGTLLKLTTKTEQDFLQSEIDAIRADVKGGVNYKGHIKTYDRHGTYPYSELSNLDFKYLVAQYYDPDHSKYWTEDPVSGERSIISSFPLNNGWMYCITINEQWLPGSGKYVTRDGIDLTDRDYVIIHNHDLALSCVELSDINRDTIDIIETQDDDYVRTPLLSSISTILSNDYVRRIQDLSNSLSIQLSSLSSQVYSISNDITSQISSISSELSTEISALSDQVEFLLSVGQRSVEYFGTVASYPGKLYKFSDFLSANFGKDFIFKRGFTFRISSQQDIYNDDGSHFEFNANDYFIFNKDCTFDSATSDSVDVIYDPQAEAMKLSSELSNLENSLSNVFKLTADNEVSGDNNFRGGTTYIEDLSVKNGTIDQIYIDRLSSNYQIAGTISASVISVDFRYVYDLTDELLSKSLADLGDPEVLQIALRVNDIITIARFDDIEKINTILGIVGDIKDRTKLICDKAGLDIADFNDLRTFRDIVDALNQAIKRIKTRGVTLESRLTTLKSNVDLVSEYATRIHRSLSALSAEVIEGQHSSSGNLSYLSGITKELSSQNIRQDSEINSISTHYNYTLKPIDRTIDPFYISSDNLVVTSTEGEPGAARDQYYVTFKYGTMVLMKM